MTLTYAIETPSNELLRYTRAWTKHEAWEAYADVTRQGNRGKRVALHRNIAEEAGYRCVLYRPLPNEYNEKKSPHPEGEG